MLLIEEVFFRESDRELTASRLWPSPHLCRQPDPVGCFLPHHVSHVFSGAAGGGGTAGQEYEFLPSQGHAKIQAPARRLRRDALQPSPRWPCCLLLPTASGCWTALTTRRKRNLPHPRRKMPLRKRALPPSWSRVPSACSSWLPAAGKPAAS